jgi:ATP-binding cassette subfamily C (CFTR/MRP) protein 1
MLLLIQSPPCGKSLPTEVESVSLVSLLHAWYQTTLANQLHISVALCRALVKNSHVLLLDEATSSVDPETDAIIQDCIRKEFSSTTLLCIAHRLATIVRERLFPHSKPCLADL